MTGAIITGPDGTRYRPTGEHLRWGDGPFVPVLVDGVLATVKTPESEHLLDADCVILELLPRIQNWPLPGPAPQFLSDEPKCILCDGDKVIVHYADIDLWHVTRHKRSGDPNHDPLGTMVPDGNGRAWLVARANPSEDA